MMITFAAFVGIAVLVVSTFALVVLERRAESEAGRIIVDEAVELALTLQRPMSTDERENVLRQLSRFGNLRITL